MSAKSSLTAWERWELASFDQDESAGTDLLSSKTAAALPDPPPALSPDEVQAIRDQARRDGLADGHAEGYDAGYREGRSFGEQEVRDQLTDVAQKLASLANSMESSLATLADDVAEEVSLLAIEIARRVTRQIIVSNPEAIVAAVREAIQHVAMQHAGIYLHPEDAALVRMYAGDYLSHSGHRIFEDQRLNRGDVRVEAGHTHLDASVATRWQRVMGELGYSSDWNPLAEDQQHDE